MKNRFVVALITLTFFACNAQEKKKNPSPEVSIDKGSIEKQVDALVEQYLDLDIFSGVVLIAEEGEPFYHRAFGLANRERKIKNTLNTKFDIGSMNKTFTKVLILQLVQEGKLKLNDKLSDFLPLFSDQIYSKITIEHLINHTAGFGDYYQTPGFFELPISEKDINHLVKRIESMPLQFEPGTERGYSNSGYILLGAIIEKVSQKNYHQNVQERIVEPLELNETYVKDKYQVPNRAIGYFKNMKGELQNNAGFVEVANPDGGFQSTANDVMKFYREFHYGHILLKEETKEMDEFYYLTQEHKTNGGAIPHAGGFEGANSVDFEILRDKISIVVLANMDEPVAEQLGAGILNIIRGKKPQKPSLPAIQNVYKAFQEKGIDFVRKNFSSLISNFHPTDPKSLILNEIGYEFLFDKQVDKAIEIFQLNTELFSDDPNVWDSLGESYLAKGDKENALINYRNALKIDPEFPSAINALKELGD